MPLDKNRLLTAEDRDELLAGIRRLFGPGLGELPPETACLLREALENGTAALEWWDDLFTLTIPGAALRVYLEAQEEPFPEFMDALVVHGGESKRLRFVDAEAS